MPLLADGDEVLGVVDGGEVIEGDVVEHGGNVAVVVIAGEFVKAFLHGPQPRKGHGRVGRRLDFEHFFLAHDLDRYLLAVVFKGLDIDAHRLVTHRTSHCIAAVAQAEVDVWMSVKQWFAVRIVSELR